RDLHTGSVDRKTGGSPRRLSGRTYRPVPAAHGAGGLPCSGFPSRWVARGGSADPKKHPIPLVETYLTYRQFKSVDWPWNTVNRKFWKSTGNLGMIPARLEISESFNVQGFVGCMFALEISRVVIGPQRR